MKSLGLNTSLLFASLLLSVACAADGTPSGDECEAGRCDSVTDQGNVSIAGGTDLYICTTGVEDLRCTDPSTGTLRPFPGSYEGTVNVSEDASGVVVAPILVHILAKPHIGIGVDEVGAGLINGVTSRGGFTVTYASAGEVLPLGEQMYWDQLDILPMEARAQGRAWTCSGSDCSDHELQEEVWIDTSVELVEYEITVLPIWHRGDYASGDYDVEFQLGARGCMSGDEYASEGERTGPLECVNGKWERW